MRDKSSPTTAVTSHNALSSSSCVVPELHTSAYLTDRLFMNLDMQST